MSIEWAEYPLTEVYDISSGLSKPRSEFGFGYGFLTFKDVLDNYFVPSQLGSLVNSTEKEQETCSIRRGDVFLTRTSETQEHLGMSAVALQDYAQATFNGFTKRLRPKADNRIAPEYAAYYFRSPSFRRAVTAMSSLSTRASLNNEMISRLKICLPPLKIQKRIGFILKALDDKSGGTPKTTESSYWDGNIPWCSVKDAPMSKLKKPPKYSLHKPSGPIQWKLHSNRAQLRRTG